MKLPCQVIEDILPMYHDGICSQESAALVEEHLKDCPHCTQLLCDLRSDIPVPEIQVDDMRPLKKLQKRYQKMRLGWLVATLCLLLLVPMLIFIGAWRLWPQSFADLIPVSENSLTDLSLYGMVQGLEEGQPFTDTYLILPGEQVNHTAAEIMEILKSSAYRQDLRNLLPWEIDSVGADKNYDGRTIIITFYTGNQKDDFITVQFLSRSIVALSRGGGSGFQIYHPTNHEIFDQLAEYLTSHGIKQDG